MVNINWPCDTTKVKKLTSDRMSTLSRGDDLQAARGAAICVNLHLSHKVAVP